MKNKILKAILVGLVLSASCLVNIAHAGVLFFDDFEDGILMNNPLYKKNDNGTIVIDFIEGDKALSFTGVDFGSDLDSKKLTSTTGNVYLSFDYLGTCNLARGCGGYIFLPKSGNNWIGTSTAYNDWGFTLTDDNTWHHYEVSFAATDFTFRLEDWGGAGAGIAGDALFDNIRFSDDGFATQEVPEPSTLAIFALGILGLASRRLKKSA